MRIIDCGLMEYHHSLALQERLVAAIGAGKEEETLLLLQHPPVYTIGRGGNPANILDPAVRVERVNRGGDVTLHGPGQVVGYPLVNLGRRGRDLHRWLRFLGEVLVHTLTAFGIKGYRRPGSTGVWTGQGKIAFIGVGVRRWVTMHGFSLNVLPDLAVFSRINPCGIRGCPVTSMTMEGSPHLSEQQVVLQLKNDFVHLLNRWLPLA